VPIYEYRCLNCSKKFERIRSVSACGTAAQCPACQDDHAYQVVSAPGGIRANGANGGMVLSEKQKKMVKEPCWEDQKTGAYTSAF